MSFLMWIIAVALAAFIWTLYTMKRDGYLGKKHKEETRQRPKKGSIIFFKDSVKHVK